jgi:hypothetical protein
VFVGDAGARVELADDVVGLIGDGKVAGVYEQPER